MNAEEQMDRLIDVRYNTVEEIAEAGDIIQVIAKLSPSERNDLAGLYTHGPLGAGDLPSTSFYQEMMKHGLVTYFVSRHQDPKYACTVKGARACELIIEMDSRQVI